MEHAVADAESLAAIGDIGKQVDKRMLGRNGLNDGRGVIGGSVIDDNDFGAPAVGLHAVDDFVQGCLDAGLLIEGGNYDAVFDLHGSCNAVVRYRKPILMLTNMLDGVEAKRRKFDGTPCRVGNFPHLCIIKRVYPNLGSGSQSGGWSMTKAELVEEVTQIGDLTRRDGEVIVDTIFDAVIGALKAGEKIEIRGFGSFRIRQRKPRIGRNPKTGAKVDVPAKRVPYFKPSKELRDLVNPGEASSSKGEGAAVE